MKPPRAICGTYQTPPLRLELEAAIAEMRRAGQKFAFAICRVPDGSAWKVQIKRGNLYSSLPGEFLSHDEAASTGAAWLAKITADSVRD